MKKILVVDDERPVVDGISLMVERDLAEEFAVAGSASSGREAIDRAFALAPDIVLMDVRMPGLSGLEAVRELRRRGSTAAFILVTAYERFDIAREAVELGVVDYLLKPVTREALAKALRGAAAWLDRLRERERREVELRDREEGLLAFAESSLALGLMLGESGETRDAALAALGVGEPEAVLGAAAFSADPGTSGSEAAPGDLYRRLREALRYRSRALVGPLVSGLCLLYLPARDGADGAARRVELREALGPALGYELASGRLRLGFGRSHPLAELVLSWSEALAALGGTGDDPPAPGGDPLDFHPDEDYLEALLAGNRGRASSALETLLSPLGRLDEVPAGAAARIIALFGAAARLLERGGLIDASVAAALLEPGGLLPGTPGGGFVAAARARGARLLEAQGGATRHSRPVARALAFIRANYQGPIGLEAAAEAAGLSPSRLSRVFVEETGRGFSEALIEHRIAVAKELLASPGATIKEVSLSCGYPDPNYFSRLFKKTTGVTPTAWIEGRREVDDEK